MGMRPVCLVQTHSPRKSGSMARAKVAVGHLLYKNKALIITPESKDVICVTCVIPAHSEHQM